MGAGKLPLILTSAGKPKALHVGTTAPPPPPGIADLQNQLVALTAKIATLQETKKRGNRGKILAVTTPNIERLTTHRKTLHVLRLPRQVPANTIALHMVARTPTVHRNAD